MSLNFSSKLYRTSSLKIRDSERIKQLIHNYANTEKISDIPKATTTLVYMGYRAWINDNIKRNPDVDLVAKYQIMTKELVEALRIMVDGMRLVSDKIRDDKSQRIIKEYLRYGEAVLMKIVVQIDDND